MKDCPLLNRIKTPLMQIEELNDRHGNCNHQIGKF